MLPEVWRGVFAFAVFAIPAALIWGVVQVPGVLTGVLAVLGLVGFTRVLVLHHGLWRGGFAES